MEVFISILFFCFVTSITPGPNNIMLMSSGLNHGVKRSVPHLLGIVVGFPLMLAAIGLGLNAIFIHFPIIHLVIKGIGAVYLLFLSFKIANAANPKVSGSIKKPLTFMQAAMFQWVNPKAWIMAVGAIATYTTQGSVYFGLAFILMGYLTLGTASMLVWLIVGAGLKKILTQPSLLKYFNWVMAGLLAASVLSMLTGEISNTL